MGNPGGRRQTIVGIGEVLWDMLPSGRQLGGAPANFAYHAQAQSARGVVVSCVGEDALGDEIIGRLDQLHLDRRHVALHASAPTGTVDVRLDEKGVPDYVIHTDVAWDFIPQSESLMRLAAEADAVCFGTLAQRSPVSRATICGFLDSTGSTCLRIFDINLRQKYFDRDTIEQSLKRASILKLNDEELPVVARLLELTGEPQAAIASLIARYHLRAVALTRGGAGSALYIDGQVLDHPGFQAKIIDTVGAGDAFTAALAVGLLRGEAPARILERANRLAAFVCSQAGATPVVPPELIS